MGYAAEFKRFSVSAGWMHVMPQGKANPFNINTAVDSKKNYGIGDISQAGFLNSIPDTAVMDDGQGIGNTMLAKPFLISVFEKNSEGSSVAQSLGFLVDNDDVDSDVSSAITGDAQLNGIEQWTAQGTGLEADNVDTFGLMLNYYVNDNVSLQVMGGIPPKVDIKGKGEIVANMTGLASPGEMLAPLFPNGLDIAQDIPITNLDNKSKAATVRAWTPALEAQYQFGKAGVNKFRPYVGAGVMYARFTGIKLDSQVNRDLVAAGHMVQNILDNQAGAALDGKKSSANPYVKVKADDAFAPIVSLGATYDITENWYGVASVSYAKLNNKTTIDVIDSKTGNRLIRGTTKIDIDPLITFVGVGYRF
nr:OmpW family outer membrane protein [Acinetobacter sp. ANC 4648]